jgi:hypothetical protein
MSATRHAVMMLRHTLAVTISPDHSIATSFCGGTCALSRAPWAVFSFRQSGVLLRPVGSAPCWFAPSRHFCFAPALYQPKFPHRGRSCRPERLSRRASPNFRAGHAMTVMEVSRLIGCASGVRPVPTLLYAMAGRQALIPPHPAGAGRGRMGVGQIVTHGKRPTRRSVRDGP